MIRGIYRMRNSVHLSEHGKLGSLAQGGDILRLDELVAQHYVQSFLFSGFSRKSVVPRDLP